MHWVNLGDWTFNPACWPDPQGMVDELQTLGIEVMVTFWPFQVGRNKHCTAPSTAFLSDIQAPNLHCCYHC